MVATKFIPNPSGKPEVNHIDENKTNDDMMNLEWVTRKENVEHSRCKPVDFECPKGNKITITNITEFCKDNNLVQGYLQKVRSGVRKQHKGYKLWTFPN